MDRSVLSVVKATITGILCLIIVASAWHDVDAGSTFLKHGTRWGVLLVMLIVVFLSERFDRKEEANAEPYISTGIVVVAMLALAAMSMINGL